MTLTTGAGAPVTVVAHGLGSSLAETRALVSGVPGTKVFPSARGHHGAAAPDVPGYAELAADLLDAAPEATQALGVSMGAGTLLRVLSEQPDRFARVVLFLPATLDRPRADVRLPLTEAAVRAELPPEATGPAVDAWVRDRVAALASLGGLAAALAADVPVHGSLGAVSAEVLVIGQEGDPLHPAQVARDVAAALPRARLEVFERPGALFWARDRLRSLVVEHLSPR